MVRSTRMVLAIAGSVIACGGGGGDTGDSGDDAGTTGPIDLPAPHFLEPADGELHIPTNRIQDVTLDVGVQAGVTRLVVDERSIGTLTTPSDVGIMTADTLQLFVRGAMVSGVHSLSLRTPDAVASESSDTVTVFVETASVPPWRFEGPLAIGTGDALVVGPSGSAAALGVVIDDAAGSRVLAFPPDADGWDVERGREVALPGYVADGATPAVAIERRIADVDAERLRVAWRVGSPGTAIATVEVAWDDTGDGTPVHGFAPDPSWLGTREYTEIGRPILADPLVLAEVTAWVDSELAHPGDRVVGFSRWSTTELATPQLVPLGPEDLDALGLVLQALPGSPIAVGMRVEHIGVDVLEVTAAGAVEMRPSDAVVSDPRWDDVEGPLVTAIGGFRSRLVAGILRDHDAVLLAWIDDSGKRESSVRYVEFPDDALATGPLALALVDGAVVVLVPRGDADAVAITTTTDKPVVQTLAGAACDVLAAPRSDVGNADAHVELACLHARVLSIGVLAPEPPA